MTDKKNGQGCNWDALDTLLQYAASCLALGTNPNRGKFVINCTGSETQKLFSL